MTTLGSVTLSVQDFSGWSYPRFGTLVGILSDGSTTGNEVLQSAAVPRRQATLSGKIVVADDVDVVHGYNATKEAVIFDESESASGDDFLVNVLDFQVRRSLPWLWEYDLTLVESC